jgi:hypothetical protein
MLWTKLFKQKTLKPTSHKTVLIVLAGTFFLSIFSASQPFNTVQQKVFHYSEMDTKSFGVVRIWRA